MSLQQDYKKNTVDTSHTFFAYYKGPHRSNGETIFITLLLPYAAKFVSFQSELTQFGTALSINEVRFLQGQSVNVISDQARNEWNYALADQATGRFKVKE